MKKYSKEEKRKGYLKYVLDYLLQNLNILEEQGFYSINSLTEDEASVNRFIIKSGKKLDGKSSERNIYKALNFIGASSENTLNDITLLFQLPVSYRKFLDELENDNPEFTKFLFDKPISEGKNVPQTSEYKPPRKIFWQKRKRIAFVSLLALCFLIIFFLINNSVKTDSTIVQFDGTVNYNILILPFRNPESNKISTVGKELEERLTQQNKLNKLGLEVIYMASDTVDITPEKARSIGRKVKGTDMVIWGNDSKPEGNSIHQIYFHFVTRLSDPTGRKMPVEGKTDKVETDRLVEITEGILQLEIDDIIYWFLGNKYYLIGDYNNALNNFLRIKNDKYRNENLYLSLAECFHNLQAWDEGKFYLEKALQINPNSAAAHHNYALLLYDLKDSLNAKIKFEISLKLNERSAPAHYNYARLLENYFNDSTGARTHYEMALNIDANFVQAHNNYGLLLENKFNDPEGAKEQYEIALKIAPNFVEVLQNYSLLLSDKLGKIEEAEVQHKKLLNISNDNAYTHYNYAYFLFDKLNDKVGAKKHYVEAIRLNPDLERKEVNNALEVK